MNKIKTLILIATFLFISAASVAQVRETFVGPPKSTDGSSLLKCDSSSCIDSLRENEDGNSNGNYVILGGTKNILTMNWEKPFGNFVIGNLTLYLTLKGCDTLSGTCSSAPYIVDLEVWNGNSWEKIKTENIPNFEKTSKYLVTGKMKLYGGEYRARVINRPTQGNEYIMVEKAELRIDYINLDKKPPKSLKNIFSYFQENLLFWRRFLIGLAVGLFILLVLAELRKNRKLKKIFKIKSRVSEVDKELDRKLKKHRSLKNKLEVLERKLNSIEASRKETQKKYYTRAIDENTFKQTMQKYEQSRTELRNEIEEIKKELERLG